MSYTKGETDQRCHKEEESDLSELFELHRKVIDPSPIDISKVFGEDSEQTVAFEVALAATVATTVLTVSTAATILDHVASMAAISLTFLTLTRKMALDNSITNDSSLMNSMRNQSLLTSTTRLMLYLRVFLVIYTGIFVAETLAMIVSVDLFIFLIIGMFLFSCIVLLVYEIVFGDLFFWMAIIFYNEWVNNKPNNILRKIAEKSRVLYSYSPHYDKYNAAHPAVRKIRFMGSANGVQRGKKFPTAALIGMTLGIVVPVAILSALTLHLVTEILFLYTIALYVLLGVSVLPLQGTLQFVLSRYGNSDFDDFSSVLDDILPILVLLSATSLYRAEQAGLSVIF